MAAELNLSNQGTNVDVKCAAVIKGILSKVLWMSLKRLLILIIDFVPLLMSNIKTGINGNGYHQKYLFFAGFSTLLSGLCTLLVSGDLKVGKAFEK